MKNMTLDRAKVKAASTNKSLVSAVKTVLEAQALADIIRPVVNADHKAEIEATAYTYNNFVFPVDEATGKRMEKQIESTRRFTYEDHLKGQGYMMEDSEWAPYSEAMHVRYMAGPFAYMIEGREVGTCPLLVAEHVLMLAQQAMMDIFKSLTGLFDTNDLLCSANGLQRLKEGHDLVIGIVVSQNPKVFKK
jgi:hypothetical protein